MHRLSQVTLGILGLFALGACADDPRGRSLPTEPSTHTVYGPADVCNNQLANTASSEISSLFNGDVRRELAAKLRDVKGSCGTTTGMRLALEYVGLVIKYKSTGNDLVVTVAESDRAKALTHHTDHVTVYAGLGAASVPYQAWLAGGGIALFPTRANTALGIVGCPAGQTPAAPSNAPAGACGLITEVYNGAGVFQQNLTSPVDFDYHIVSLARSTFDFTQVTNLQKLTNDAFQLNYFPAAAGFAPALTGYVCTDDEGSEEEGGTGPSFVKVGHFVNGKTDVLPRWVGKPTSYFCSHGAPPVAVAPGARGVLEGFVARALNALSPRPLYAINEGPDFEHTFADGMSPLGPLNTLVFNANFSNEASNSTPLNPIVGQQWIVNETTPGWIRIKETAGDLTDKPVVLNQAQGCTTDCGTIELVGRLYEPNTGQHADEGVYSMTFKSLQDRPTIFQANHVLRSFAGLEIATLRYATINGQSVLQYNTPTGYVNVGTWTVHFAQSFEIVIDLDAKTTSLKINGVAVSNATNVPFIQAAADFSRFAWENSGIDSGKIAYDDILIFRHADQ
jgi:hypothetical protein